MENTYKLKNRVVRFWRKQNIFENLRFSCKAKFTIVVCFRDSQNQCSWNYVKDHFCLNSTKYNKGGKYNKRTYFAWADSISEIFFTLFFSTSNKAFLLYEYIYIKFSWAGWYSIDRTHPGNYLSGIWSMSHTCSAWQARIWQDILVHSCM